MKYNQSRGKSFLSFSPSFIPKFTFPNMIESHEINAILNEFNNTFVTTSFNKMFLCSSQLLIVQIIHINIRAFLYGKLSI